MGVRSGGGWDGKLVEGIRKARDGIVRDQGWIG